MMRKIFESSGIARPVSRFFWSAFCVVGLATAVIGQDAPADADGAAEPEKAEEEEVELQIPQSVFVSEPRQKSPKEGLDPFFPKSTRRDPLPPEPTPEELAAKKAAEEAAAKKAAEAESAAPPPPSDPFDDLTLKAVIGGRRPLATISTGLKNYYFAPGEWRMVQVPNHAEGGVRLVRLECVSVDAKGVTLKIDNKDEVRPLKMPLKPIGN